MTNIQISIVKLIRLFSFLFFLFVNHFIQYFFRNFSFLFLFMVFTINLIAYLAIEISVYKSFEKKYDVSQYKKDYRTALIVIITIIFFMRTFIEYIVYWLFKVKEGVILSKKIINMIVSLIQILLFSILFFIIRSNYFVDKFSFLIMSILAFFCFIAVSIAQYLIYKFFRKNDEVLYYEISSTITCIIAFALFF